MLCSVLTLESRHSRQALDVLRKGVGVGANIGRAQGRGRGTKDAADQGRHPEMYLHGGFSASDFEANEQRIRRRVIVLKLSPPMFL
jgi:hypothetical protein